MLLAAYTGISCKCGWGGNFLRVANHQDLIVKARILKFYKVHSDIYEKMEVEVLKIVKGRETRKKIMVWGDNGMLCRPYISTFKKGETYYLALGKEEKDYEISVCGQHWLQVTNDKVQLKKNEGDKEDPKPMTTAELEKALAENK